MALTRAGVARDDRCHGGRAFPAHEPLNDVGRRQAEAVAAQVNRDARGFAAPERIVDLIGRVAGWLEWLSDNTSPAVSVTHPAVILLALDGPPKSFWCIDIAPVSRTVLHFRNGCWTLRL